MRQVEVSLGERGRPDASSPSRRRDRGAPNRGPAPTNQVDPFDAKTTITVAACRPALVPALDVGDAGFERPHDLDLRLSPGWMGSLLRRRDRHPATRHAARPRSSRLTLSALDEVATYPQLCRYLPARYGAHRTGDECRGRRDSPSRRDGDRLVAGRGCSYGLIRRARRRRMLVDRAVVVGAGVVGAEVERDPALAPRVRRPGGRFHRRSSVHWRSASARRRGVARGDPSSRPDQAGHRGVRSPRESPSSSTFCAGWRSSTSRCTLVPRFFDIGVAPAGRCVDDLRGIPSTTYHVAGRHRWSRSGKRFLDVLLASPVFCSGSRAARSRRCRPGQWPGRCALSAAAHRPGWP